MSEALIIAVLPLVFANILHMIVVKQNLYSSLKIPINNRMFGENKTWRGVVVLTLLSSFFSALTTSMSGIGSWKYGAMIGAVLGLTYMVFELPNSLFKRSIGIKSGEVPKKNKLFYMLLDKMDSVFGVCLVLWLITNLSSSNAVLLFVLSVGLHIILSQLLVLLGIKKRF